MDEKIKIPLMAICGISIVLFSHLILSPYFGFKSPITLSGFIIGWFICAFTALYTISTVVAIIPSEEQ